MSEIFKDFNEDQATSIGSQSSAVTGPGVFKIDDCKVYVQNERTIAEFTLAPKDGRKTLKFVKLLLTKEDKTAGFGANQWNAIRGLLNLKSLETLKIETVQEDVMNVMTNVNYIRGMEGKEIGLLMQRYNWGNSDDGRYYKYSMNILLPFDKITKQTYAEKKNNQAAKALDKRVPNTHDKTADGLSIPTTYQSSTPKSEVKDTPGDVW